MAQERQERPLGPIFEDPDEHKNDQAQPKKSLPDDDSFSDDSIGLPAFKIAGTTNKITFPKTSFDNFIHRHNVPPDELVLPDTSPTMLPPPIPKPSNFTAILTADLLGDLEGSPSSFVMKPNPALNIPLKPSDFMVTKRMTRVTDDRSQEDQDSPPDSIAEIGGFDSDSADSPVRNSVPANIPSDDNDHTAEAGGRDATVDKYAPDHGHIRSAAAERPDADRPFSIESWQERRFSSVIQSQTKQSPISNETHTPERTGNNVSQHEASRLELEIVHLQTALGTANAEIEDLVKAIHNKDQNVIEAQETIKRLTGGVDRRESLERGQRLDRMAGRLKELESENDQLRLNNHKTSQENADLKDLLHDIEETLGMDNIPGDEQELRIHMKARINSLVETEKNGAAKQSSKHGHIEEWDVFQHESTSLRRALSIKDEQSAQHEKVRKQLEEQTKRMEQELAEMEKKAKHEEELSHLIAAEARALSDELKNAHVVIERKDALIVELQQKSGLSGQKNDNEFGNFWLPIELTENSNTIKARNQDPSVLSMESVLRENADLKATVNALTLQLREMERSADDKPHDVLAPRHQLSGRLNGQRPDLVSDRQQPELRNGMRHARRELRIVNAALAQVVSSANNAINHMKAENSALLSRNNELERTESQYRQEVSDKKQHIDQLIVELSTARAALQASNQMRHQEDLVHQRSSMQQEWGDHHPKDNLVGEFSTIIKDMSTERLQLVQSILSQQRLPTDSLIQVQHEVRLLQTALDNNAHEMQNGQDKLLSQLYQYIQKNRSDDARIISDYQDTVKSLQKIIADRDMEIVALNDSARENSSVFRHTQSLEDPGTITNQEFVSKREDEYHRETVWSNRTPMYPSRTVALRSRSSPDDFNVCNKTASGTRMDDCSSANMLRPDLLEAQILETMERVVLLGESPGIAANFMVPPVQSSESAVMSSPRENRDLDLVALSKRKLMSKFQEAEVENVIYEAHPSKQSLDKMIPKMLLYNKLELPRVDYDSIRQRTEMQLEQLRNLSDRIDKANQRYANCLPVKSPSCP